MAKYKNNDIIKGLDNNLYIVRPMEEDYGLNKCLGCVFNRSTTKRHESNCNTSMRKRTLQEFKDDMDCYKVINTNMIVKKIEGGL